MVEVMKIMATSFKTSCGDNATLSALDHAAGHHRRMPLPQTLGHPWASLGQSLVRSLLLSPGSLFAQVLFVPFKSLFSHSPVIASSMVRLTATSPRGLMPYPGLLCSEPLPM